MNILYFGGFCDPTLINKVAKLTNSPFIVAQNKLEQQLLKGLIEEFTISKIFCMPTVPYYLLSKRLFIKSQITHSEYGTITTLPTIKIPLLRYLFYFIYSFFYVLFWKSDKKDTKSIFISINFIPVSTAVLFAAKLRGIEVTIMLTDCARNTYNIKKTRIKSRFKKKLLNLYINFVVFIEKRYSAYVFLTQKMNEIINVRKKPYVIVEGIYQQQENVLDLKRPNTKKIILYAGSLFEIYGISKIIEVSSYIKDDNIEFHFYGGGEFSELLKKFSLEDKRIKFFGFVDQKTLFKAMVQATLLINLRDPNLEYTSLSFPSKMFDYMLSGTPVLSTRLTGIPEEYYNYIFMTDSYEAKGISKQIESITNLEYSYLLSFGNKAKEFIIDNKNYKIQGKKIINLINNKINKSITNSHEGY